MISLQNAPKVQIKSKDTVAFLQTCLIRVLNSFLSVFYFQKIFFLFRS